MPLDHGTISGSDHGCAAVPDSNSQAAQCRHLFSKQAPHPAGSLPFFKKFRGLESNQRLPGSEPGATTNSSCPGMKLGEKDLNLHNLVQSQAAYR